MNYVLAKFNEKVEDEFQTIGERLQVPASVERIESARGRRAGSEQRRRRVLDAARACFGEAGFAGATIGTIAERAGVSNGLLYQFFRSKEHLFEVVLREIIGDWVRAMVPREAAEESPSQALEGMFRRSVEFCRRHPLLPALLRGDAELQLSRIRAAGRDRVQPHRDLVASLLRRGIEAGEFKRDLDVPSVADVICQLQGDYSGRAYRRDPEFPDSPAIVEAATRFLLDAVRA
jgi:TetR/AcrR family fatty acid metabolism transcriptional regulator